MDTRFILTDAEAAVAAAQHLYAKVEQRLKRDLPPGVDIRHIGATAVPGCLTKGDLDVLVRVPPEGFAATESALARLYERNLGSLRTETFAAFEDAAETPHLGIQLVAAGGPQDFFHHFIEALRASPELLADYNALKRRYDGSSMDAYRSAKDRFIARVLAEQGGWSG